MAIDWGLAGQIGGVGFSLVFAVLIILAVTIWIVRLVINKVSTGKSENSNNKKEGS